jgi:hypothetical protein
MMATQPERQSTAATSEDVKNILGEIDTGKLMAIMSLKPTLAEVETASIWLAGDADVFGAGEPIKGAASEIVGILTADEEEPPPAA